MVVSDHDKKSRRILCGIFSKCKTISKNASTKRQLQKSNIKKISNKKTGEKKFTNNWRKDQKKEEQPKKEEVLQNVEEVNPVGQIKD